ncbi:RagB/SusD family nutrient uptake outer membrane protein [Mucilaginibacter paludis]|uniref:RagB/SusD domain-containing protein n=1 Tax=Mucilaginibacter paludis DSM 18603 TaxID=714943 RepID=H1YEL8_9SPHI|nr:RagB/SusD family nutrient uptake outer membrane protein [Mucilaginibacter paludis]EHQ30778.1 RagB/SusD domain-containing protein [Mucilaginibacter paludis DSM 18603]
MKIKIYPQLTKLAVIAGIASCALVSCKKFISPEPVSSFSQQFVFSNLPYAKAAVIGVYNNLSGQNSYGLYYSMYYPYDTDEMMGAGGNTQDGERRDLARYNITSTNGGISAAYANNYSGIERANICIEQIPQMALYSSGSAIEKGELRRLYGEALTLRAQFYFDLVKVWGDVPAQWLPSAEMPTLFIPKTDRDTIYNRLLNDLKTAEDLVPWRTEIATLGDAADERITKVAVKALRARIALFRGGYSLRRVSNAMERRADYKTYYTIARDECADIMARRDQHTLNASYKALWQTYVCGRNANEPNGEFLFQIAEGGNTGTTDGRIGVYNGTKVGQSSNGSLSILPTYYYSFDSTDVRRDVTAAPYETKNDLVSRTGHAITNIPDGKFRREWWSNPVNPTLATLQSGINWILIRFSDVLLMYAEADNELNGAPSQAAISAVNEVSKRAHGGNQALVPAIPTDYTGFFKYLVRERYLEFGGEGIRKYDLIRWNLLTAAIAETKVNLANMGAAVPLAMNAPSYMASPAPYCLSATLPQFMYYWTTLPTVYNGSNLNTYDDSRIWANSLYKPAPTTTPANTTKVNWVGVQGTSGFNAVYTNLFAFAFKPNHSELYPIYINQINASAGVLTQDYNY